MIGSDLVLPASVVMILLPAVVARLLRARLLGVGDDPGTGGPSPADATARRTAVMRLLCGVTIVVALVQAAAGYQMAQLLHSLSGSEGPRGWIEVWDERRAANLAIAIVPALVLGVLLVAALQRGRAHRLYSLSLGGNITLAVVGLLVSFVVNNTLF